MTNQRNSFILYHDSLEILDRLSDEQAGKIFKAIKVYQKTREVPQLDFALEIAFFPFLNQFKRDAQKWEAECRNSSEKGKLGNLKRWHFDLFQRVEKGELSLEAALFIATDRPPILPDPTRSPPIPKSLDSVTVPVSVPVSVSKRFIAPTLQEVQTYCQERKNSVNPQKWLDHYESNGWKVGKNSMKDWKAAVRKWENSDFNSAPSSQTKISSFADELNAIAGSSLFEKIYEEESGGEKVTMIKFTSLSSKDKWSALPDEVKNAVKEKIASKFNGKMRMA